MPNSVMQLECLECKGYGYIYFGDEKQYDVEPCNCVTNPTNPKE